MNGRTSVAIICAFLFAFGLWACLYPSGALRWAKKPNSRLDPEDRRFWWIPRLIGALFLLMSLFMGFAGLIYSK